MKTYKFAGYVKVEGDFSLEDLKDFLDQEVILDLEHSETEDLSVVDLELDWESLVVIETIDSPGEEASSVQ